MVTITQQFEFSAAHRLNCRELSAQENRDLFGKCNNPNGHGHTYGLEVTVEGEIYPETGYVMDFGDLDRIVDGACIDHLDHKNLDLDVPWLSGIRSTAENIVVAWS